jgi:flagellar biosynthesis protein FlhF
LGVPDSSRKIVALIGPPGCGKTTTLAKLAIQYGLVPRLRTQLLTIDMERIGAADQLQSLASILGVGFASVETNGGLVHALEEHQQKELILIDSPGFGPREIAGAAPLAELLRSRNDIDVHLVLPASMKNADIARTVDRFEIFRPAKLIFTRLDETESAGCIINEVLRTGKPLSFLNFGQRIPEDLRAGDRTQLANLILGEQARKAAAFAA